MWPVLLCALFIRPALFSGPTPEHPILFMHLELWFFCLHLKNTCQDLSILRGRLGKSISLHTVAPVLQQTLHWDKDLLLVIMMIFDSWCGVWLYVWTQKEGILLSNSYLSTQTNSFSASSAVTPFHGKPTLWDSCSQFLWVCVCFPLYFYEMEVRIGISVQLTFWGSYKIKNQYGFF